MIRDKNSVHIVIDIETLGTVDSLIRLGSCPILEAAFVVVEHVKETFTMVNQFTTPFSLKNQNEDAIDVETIEWHQAKNPNYTVQMDACNRADDVAHLRFYANISAIYNMASDDGKKVHFWSKGKDFDFTILKAYALQQGFQYPWMEGYNFVNIHCLRDLIYFSGFDEKSIKNPNLHSALSDAITEAKVLAAILNEGS